MRKIGPLIVIINGLLAAVFGLLGILAAQNVFEMPSFLIDFDKQVKSLVGDEKLVSSVLYGISIAIGVVEILFGYWVLKHPKGFLSFILIIIIAASIGLTVWNSVQAKDWPVATIITLSINGIALLGLGLGFFGGSKEKAKA